MTLGGAAGLALVVLGAMVGCQRPASVEPATFVGAAKCATCHQKEAAAYRGSDHARAMQQADDTTVLGDFHNARFTHRGVTSTFFRRDGKFLVRTDGPDGKLNDFEITHTFGVTPLQQYLVPLPDGRLQALGIAWDTRSKAQGGQRWFHLYPGQTFLATDPLHWTGREQTSNYQCAECHSTDLRRNYNAAQHQYATTWAELTVSCEACHGPGSAHLAWAERRPAGSAKAPAGTTGLVVRLDRAEGAWAVTDRQHGIAEWNGRPRSSAEVEACARCHARRRPIVEPYPYGRPFPDTHLPALLEPGLYHVDVRSWERSLSTARSFRVGCFEPASPVPTVTSRTASGSARPATPSARSAI